MIEGDEERTTDDLVFPRVTVAERGWGQSYQSLEGRSWGRSYQSLEGRRSWADGGEVGWEGSRVLSYHEAGPGVLKLIPDRH